MFKLTKICFIILALFFISAIKTHYGGEICIRLNEPPSFSNTPSSYSNLIFYSLIYENFFYLKGNGEIYSNIFKHHSYEKSQKILTLTLNDYLSFSNGEPVTANKVMVSLKLYLDLNLSSSIKLRRIIKNINVEKNKIIIELLYDNPDIIGLLTRPELVLMSGNNQALSGMFYPVEWTKNKHIVLKPNKFYSGGRTYLDSVKVVFYDLQNLDVFLSKPLLMNPKYGEFNAGIYQNIYISFPEKKIGQNTRIALYSLLKMFYKPLNLSELNSLTSNDESPISLNIKEFSMRRVKSILRYSKIKLYILSSLGEIEEEFKEFLRENGIRIDVIYISDNQLHNFINNTSIKYLLLEKIFNKRTPMEEKVKKIIKEMTFTRFDETYLKLINELDEIKSLKNEEILVEQTSKIIEKMINDGFLLPLYQKRYSLYINKKVQGIELDYYGRPLFQGVRIK